jgi:hypothetical protein
MHPNMVVKVSHIVYAKLDVTRISAAAEKQENYATASAMEAYHVQINDINYIVLLFESLFESFPIGFIHYNNLILN